MSRSAGERAQTPTNHRPSNSLRAAAHLRHSHPPLFLSPSSINKHPHSLYQLQYQQQEQQTTLEVSSNISSPTPPSPPHHTIYSPRAPPKPHPCPHTSNLPCQKVAAARQARTPAPAPASDFDTREHVYIDPRDQFAWPLLPSNVPPAQGKIVRFLSKSAKKRCCSPNNSRRTTSPSLRHTYGLASCQQSNLS